MTVIKKTTNVGEDIKEKEHLHTAGGNVNWGSHCGKQYGRYSKNKNKPTIQSSHPTPGYIFENENTNVKGYRQPNIHSSIIYNGQDMEAT